MKNSQAQQESGRRRPAMDRISLAMCVGVLFLLAGSIGWKKGGTAMAEGLRNSGELFLRGGPHLVLGFLIAGFLGVLVPDRLASRWMGEESGAKGLWVGTLAGVVTPGGPFTHFPILSSLAQKGAGVGPLTAYIAAWSLLGLHRTLIWEAPFLGWRFTFARMGACLLFPPLMGWLARGIASLLSGRSPVFERG
jgi:uncharacterized membrane protein YraQ (UPF0718 family)